MQVHILRLSLVIYSVKSKLAHNAVCYDIHQFGWRKLGRTHWKFIPHICLTESCANTQTYTNHRVCKLAYKCIRYLYNHLHVYGTPVFYMQQTVVCNML